MSLKDSLPEVKIALPGPRAEAELKRRKEVMPDAVKSIYPLVIERGEGAMIEDVDGNKLLDWVGGVGVLNVGYSQPELIAAVREQSEKFFHSMMNITTSKLYLDYVEKINGIAPVSGDAKKTMLCNTGAEANENAVKIARSVTGRSNIIVFTGAFHGRTLMAMTMTSKKAYAIDMGPFPDGFYRAPFPYAYRAPKGMAADDIISYYIQELKNLFETHTPAKDVAAIVFEPVQGEGGFIPAPIEWVKAVREICDENGILLITDEVQTGFARTGKLFASEYYKEAGVAPDIMTFAKSIAGGLPLSGVVTSREIMDKVTVGTIGGTYNGNAVACASALAVLGKMIKEDYPKKARQIAEKCMARFNDWKDKYDVIGDVRGLGAMMGIEFVKDKKGKEPNAELVNKIVLSAVQKGLILESAGTYGNVIRFLCPLCVTDEQLEKGLEIFEETIKELL
ncbi:MAG: aspartate aminotransferase family protein [Clostridiales Family XIII bacterium]|jgi:4-aminobutyrate aminotransferase/(S)-3-amino-2-methylpropionate transaminase|nr:aspartate aminotransferase family protein [Clostridiales Family XIII bacterium]